MLKEIERKILIFTEAYGVEKAEIVHGTLFVKFKDPADKEDFRKSLKSMMKMFIEQDTGVNGNVVGDEYAYDFVPEKDEKGWNTTETQESIISTQLELQEGK
tara:strand:- start:24 stop:329 length:306 start_codon:yes stop_codon:yes gene_type:complete